MIATLVRLLNFLNKQKVNYNLIDEHDQIRVELFLKNHHDTQGDYIVVDDGGLLHMNLFHDLDFRHVERYINDYNNK